MTQWRDPERHVRTGVPPFVDAYNRVRDLIKRDGLEAGEQLALARWSSAVRSSISRASLPTRHCCSSRRTGTWRATKTAAGGWPRPRPPDLSASLDGFHRQLRHGATPVLGGCTPPSSVAAAGVA